MKVVVTFSLIRTAPGLSCCSKPSLVIIEVRQEEMEVLVLLRLNGKIQYWLSVFGRVRKLEGG